MISRRHVWAAGLTGLLALTGCGGDAPEEQPASPTTQAGTEANAGAAVPQDAIPPAMRGRWGLVAADCERGRADAKGLMVVGAEQLEFYESVGRLENMEEAAAGRIMATFAFTGEGMEWDRPMELVLEENAAALVRRESGEGAMEGSLRYERCPGAGA